MVPHCAAVIAATMDITIGWYDLFLYRTVTSLVFDMPYSGEKRTVIESSGSS